MQIPSKRGKTESQGADKRTCPCSSNAENEIRPSDRETALQAIRFSVRNKNSEKEYMMPASGRNNTLKLRTDTPIYGDKDLSVDPLTTVRNLRSGRLAF